MALEVGIVGLPGSGKTTLFTALTKTGGGEYGKTNVGMAPIADERLEALAAVVKARKVTPAAIRVQDVPGTGAALLGNLRQVDALLVVLDGFGADATRTTTSRRSSSSCSSPTATTSSGGSSGSRSRRSRATRSSAPRSRSCEQVLAHVDGGGDARRTTRASCRPSSSR